MIDLSRLNTFLLVERFKIETPESIFTSPSTKIQGFATIHRCSSSPPSLLLYNDCKGGEADGPHKGNQSTQTVVDLTQPLGWIINREKFEIKPTQVFLFLGYEYHLDSALVKPTQEKWSNLQDLILRLKSKHVLTARCLMSLIELLASMEKMDPEGRLHMRPFQFHLKEHWRYPQSLDSLLPWSETISVHLEWWPNPTNVMKDVDLHPKDQIPVSKSLQMPQSKVGVLT